MGDLWAKNRPCGMMEGLELSCCIADKLEACLACGGNGCMGADVVVVQLVWYMPVRVRAEGARCWRCVRRLRLGPFGGVCFIR